MARFAGNRTVLTGGASQLTGMAEAAAECLGKQVRLGVPANLEGGPASAQSPGFAVASGLLHYALKPDAHSVVRNETAEAHANTQRSYMAKMGRWFVESF